MKKTRRWRAMRLQKKRENQRLGKQMKPEHDHVFSRAAGKQESTWDKMMNFLARPVPKAEKHDRREKNQRQGDR